MKTAISPRARAPRTAPMAAALAIGFALALALPSQAGPGHDHGDASAGPVVRGNGPQRLPDGRVFLPKPAQRQLGVRTQQTAEGELPLTVELNAKVVMDPSAGGQVQAMNAGRLEVGPRGMPHAGQVVRKGEVLAHVQPTASPMERGNQIAQLAELRAAKALAEKRLARLQGLADTVPRKDIEAAESEVSSLTSRMAAVGGALSAREALVAPVGGVIASSHAVTGQVVEARELLFEIVDPKRLHVEALAYDPAVAADVGAAWLAVGKDRVPLTFLGAARSLRQQALPMTFRAEGAALAALAVGQPTRVFVHTRQTLKGLAVPVAALVKNAANQPIVWVKTAPEHLEPRSVNAQPLDGVSVAITSGLKAGERVVVQGAGLINQIR